MITSAVAGLPHGGRALITSDVARAADFRLCAEALIDRAIITAANDRALLEKIRRHQSALQATFGRLTGWRVQAHPEFARLVKTPARAEASHGLAWAKGRLDYALLAWALWYGEHTHGRKFTVSQIAEEIKLRSGGADGPGLDWTTREQRLAARRVFRGLEEMGVLRLQDGSVEEWADENGKRDALYAWGDAAWRVHVGIPAAELERLAEGHPAPRSPAPPADGTDEIRLAMLRERKFARLLDDLHASLVRNGEPKGRVTIQSREEADALQDLIGGKPVEPRRTIAVRDIDQRLREQSAFTARWRRRSNSTAARRSRGPGKSASAGSPAGSAPSAAASSCFQGWGSRPKRTRASSAGCTQASPSCARTPRAGASRRCWTASAPWHSPFIGSPRPPVRPSTWRSWPTRSRAARTGWMQAGRRTPCSSARWPSPFPRRPRARTAAPPRGS